MSGNVVAAIPEENMVIVVTWLHYGQCGMHKRTMQSIEQHVVTGFACE